ncbi:NfeD family protein [Streptomyces sp. NPDC097619]|uniref:NfeD family protein n=1 Tax=Streptomyces sp. NPDC097619 TaxID=3157228 RepID=UPI0033269609
MEPFLGLGIAGTVLLACSLLFDGVLEGLTDGLGAGFPDGLLSLPVIAGFVSMLGFTGALIRAATGAGPVPAAVVGTLAGAGTAWAALRFGRALTRDGGGAAPGRETLVGSTGTVVTAIPAAGYGEVLLRPAGQTVKFSATAEGPVPRGTEVWVTAVASAGSVSVRAVER